MNKITDFLDELDDYELAYFAKFKLITYMKDTQSEIKEYLIKRNVNESKIETLISKNPISKLNDKAKRCPRCYSDKLRKNKVEWTETTDKFGLEDEIATLDGITGRATYKEEVVCNVCEFCLEDPNNEKPKSFRKKVTTKIWEFINGI